MLDGIEFWHWWTAALILAALEAVVPGVFLIWLGLAAGVVGALMLVVDMDWPLQMFLFAVFAAVGAFVGVTFFRRGESETDHPDLNRRGAQYVGRIAVLATPIVNGRGRAKLGDSIWMVQGADTPEGAKVRVVGVDGVVLQVERTY